MITCPRCGAENKDDAPVCRMCATPLDAAAAAPARPAAPAMADMPATVLIPSPGAPGHDAPGGRAPAGKSICPACGATNDSDWAFCQQCGSRLAVPAPAAPAPQWSPTVVTPPPPLPPTAPPPAVPPAAQWGAPTVISPTPDFGQPPVPPQAPPPAAPWGAPTVITPVADLGQYGVPPLSPAPPPVAPPPPAPPSAPAWGAETVVTPSPDFGQVVPPPVPAWGAATVVTPPPPPPPVAPPAISEIPTVVSPPQVEPQAYLDTIVDPDLPPAQSGGTSGFATDEVPTAGVPVVAPEPSYVTTPTATPTAGIGQPPQAAAAPPADQHTIVMSSTPVASPPKSGKLLLIMEGGDVGETFQLRPTETGIGRVEGDIKFPHDGYMSSRHARILQRNGRFFLIDNNSRNGTFVKIHQEVELHAGDVVLIGKQLFRFEADE